MTRDDEQLVEEVVASVEARIDDELKKVSAETRGLLEHLRSHLLSPIYSHQALRSQIGLTVDSFEQFNIELGKCFDEYLVDAKLNVAIKLLSGSKLSFTRIGSLVGFDSPFSFRRSCKRHTELVPAQIRRIYGNKYVENVGLKKQHILVGQNARQIASSRRKILTSAVLFELLSEESRKASNHDVHQGLVLAEDALIHVKASRAFLGDRFGGLYALALARLGNAQCLAGKLISAQKSFKKSWEIWAKAAQKDKAVEAEILSREANIHIFQRNFFEAYELLDRSFSLALELKDIPLQVNIHLQRAGSYGYSGEPWKMPAELEAAKRKLSDHTPGDRLRLLWVNQDLLFVYIDVGAFSKADKLMSETEALACELNYQPSLHRLAWIKGLLSKEREEGTKAEQFLREARAGLSAQGDLDATAVVGLDLAVLYHKQGRTRDVRRTVVYEVLPALDRLHHSEAVAAFKLLQESIDDEVTIEVLEQAYALLRRAPDSLNESGFQPLSPPSPP